MTMTHERRALEPTAHDGRRLGRLPEPEPGTPELSPEDAALFAADTVEIRLDDADRPADAS